MKLRQRIEREGLANRVELVASPEWPNETVYVQAVRASAIEEVSAIPQDDSGKALASWVSIGACDKQGKRLFTADDVAWLMSQPLGLIQRIAERVIVLSGMGEDEKKE